jgi:hypothetical protein
MPVKYPLWVQCITPAWPIIRLTQLVEEHFVVSCFIVAATNPSRDSRPATTNLFQQVAAETIPERSQVPP